MRIRTLPVAALLLAAASPARAQEWFWGAAYTAAVPVSATRDFTGDFSYRGAMVEGRKLVGGHASFGVSFGWQLFTGDVDGTAFFGDSLGQVPAINALQNRYTNTFPLYLNAHYYLGALGGTRPFVGLNVGTAHIERRVDVGLYSIYERNWHLALAPEVGVTFPLTWVVRGMVSARYHYALEAGGTPAQQHVTFNIGFASR